MTWQRAMTVYVEVESAWLDPDGEDADHKEAWAEMAKDIQLAIYSRFNPHGRDKNAPTFDYDWDADPKETEEEPPCPR